MSLSDRTMTEEQVEAIALTILRTWAGKPATVDNIRAVSREIYTELIKHDSYWIELGYEALERSLLARFEECRCV